MTSLFVIILFYTTMKYCKIFSLHLSPNYDCNYCLSLNITNTGNVWPSDGKPAHHAFTQWVISASVTPQRTG